MWVPVDVRSRTARVIQKNSVSKKPKPKKEKRKKTSESDEYCNDSCCY